MQPYRLPWQKPGLVGHVVSGQPLFPQFGMDLSKFYSMRPPTVDKPQDQGVEAADEESHPETAEARASTPAGSKVIWFSFDFIWFSYDFIWSFI